MEKPGFNEWDFCPVNLKTDEINEPLKVLSAFFNDDWLPGHLERLKQWRDCVLNEKYFLDEKQSPYGLLYFWKLNICLIEAVYLLKERGCLDANIQGLEDLKHEQEVWRDYPANLTESQFLQPGLILDEFFTDYNLPHYRNHLYEWLEYGLSSKAANEFIETVTI